MAPNNTSITSSNIFHTKLTQDLSILTVFRISWGVDLRMTNCASSLPFILQISNTSAVSLQYSFPRLHRSFDVKSYANNN